MNASTDGAARCRTLAGENTSPRRPWLAGSAAKTSVRMNSTTTARSPVSPEREPSRLQAGSTWLAPVLLGLVTLAFFSVPHASTLLQFDRAALVRGHLWRLVTCHFVHFNASHVLWDVAAFALLAGLLPRLSMRSWSALLGSSALVISAGVCLLQPQFEFYRGLSGLDCALFGAVVTFRTREAFCKRDRIALVIASIAALGFVAKCLFELATETSAFVASGAFTPVPLAHLLGGVCGAAFGVAHRKL